MSRRRATTSERPFVAVEVFCARGHSARRLACFGQYTDTSPTPDPPRTLLDVWHSSGETFSVRATPGKAAPHRTMSIGEYRNGSAKVRMRCPSCPMDTLLTRDQQRAMLAEMWRPGARETREVLCSVMPSSP